MDQDNTQGLEDKLQQQVSSLLSRRFGSIENEVQRLQASINEFCEHLLTYAGNETTSSEEIATLSAELRQTLSAESDRHSSQAVASALAQAESEFQNRLAEAESQINDLRAQLAVSQQSATVTEAAPSSPGGFDLLRNAIAELDDQKTQADALSSLVNHAVHFAPRVAFFVLKGGNAMGWKAAGFDNGLTDQTVRSLVSPVDAVPLFRQAIEQQQTATAGAEALSESIGVLGSYGEPVASHAVAIPLTVRNKVAAVLYADTGAGDRSALNREAIESLLHFTSLVVELLPVRRNLEQPRPATPAQPRVSAPEPAPEPAARPETEAEPQEAAPAAPVFYGGLGDEQSSPEPEPAQPAVSAAGEEAEPSVPDAPDTVESFPVVTPATIASESPSAFAPTQIEEPAQKSEQQQAPAMASSTSASAGSSQRTTSVLPGNASEAEVRAHNDARRFARLLVSEIKLYNETKVADGRRSHDLYERLKEDIDRSRQMYEKRVPSTVAAKYDYFYDELVHTLAEGDSAKLGHGCPGPTVPTS